MLPKESMRILIFELSSNSLIGSVTYIFKLLLNDPVSIKTV